MQTPSSKFSMVSSPSSFSLPHAAGLKLADVTSIRRELPRLSEYTFAWLHRSSASRCSS